MGHRQQSFRGVLRQRPSEDFDSTAIPVTFSHCKIETKDAKSNRSSRSSGFHGIYGLKPYYQICCFGKYSRTSGSLLLAIFVIALWNGSRISFAWKQIHQQQVSVAMMEDNVYHYQPNDHRVGVYPRSVQYLYKTASATEGLNARLHRLNPTVSDYNGTTMGRQRHDNLPPWKLMALYKQRQQQLDAEKNNTDSRDAVFDLPDPFETDDCKAQYAWQLTSYPTCNNLHEVDMTRLNSVSRQAESQLIDSADFPSRLKYIASGYWRDVWTVQELDFRDDNRQQQNQSDEMYYSFVLKTMRYEHEFVGRNYDRHRRDALAAERLTKSSFVVDIYGFCGNSGLFEYGDGGDIVSAIWPSRNLNATQNITQVEKLLIGTDVSELVDWMVSAFRASATFCFLPIPFLRFLSATQAASGLADFHNIDHEGRASMAHTDISPGQFIKIGKRYKLNDFNRARFLRWNVEKNEPCGYYVDRNPGRNRSPEEYNYRLQSEKVLLRCLSLRMKFVVGNATLIDLLLLLLIL